MSDSKLQIVRLYGLALPEQEHPFYAKTHEALENKLKGKSGWIEWFENSLEGYPVAMLYLNGTNANLELVSEGFAWYDNRAGDLERFENAEVVAREKRLGLWSTNDVRRPWEKSLTR